MQTFFWVAKSEVKYKQNADPVQKLEWRNIDSVDKEHSMNGGANADY